MRYGFIGLGHLGQHLAGSLVREGFPLTIHDRDRSRAEPLLERGALWADSPQAMAASVDAVITCLPSPAISQAVLTGPDGILSVNLAELRCNSVVRVARGLMSNRRWLMSAVP